MSTAPETPVVVAVGEHVVLRYDTATAEVVPLDRVGPWTLLAQIELEHGRPVVVLEDLVDPTGPLVYLEPGGEVLRLAKTLERTRVDEGECYGGLPKSDVVDVERDVLREVALAGGDPSLVEVARLLPPITRAHDEAGGRLDLPHAFVGTPQCADVVPLAYDPRYGSYRVNPLAVSAEIAAAVADGDIREGLYGGWLPAVRMQYDRGDGPVWECMLFAVADPPTPYIQPGLHRYLRVDGGTVTESHYYDSYLPYPWSGELAPERFYTELYRLHARWSDEVPTRMRAEVPERWIEDFCRHAFVLERISRVGDHPRYGVVTRDYGGPDHDGFQDILTNAVTAYLEWGAFDIATRYLRGYFEEFVRPDGSIDYRGPEIGQYARMLTVLALHYAYTGDADLLLELDPKVQAIIRILEDRRQTALARPSHDPTHGLIRGRHEADISFITPTLATADYEQPYLNLSAEAWRGFRDLTEAWRRIGEDRGNPDLLERANQLGRAADELRTDLDAAIDRSVLHDRGDPYLPPIAGSFEHHLDHAYRATPVSFDDNRVWCELFYSGALRKDIAEIILAHQHAHRGTVLGMFSNRRQAVVFLSHGQMHGLLQHDLVEEFLLVYYALLLHMHTRGTWSVYECVDPDRQRAEHMPFCAPAQLVAPMATRWMLLFEDPQSRTLWLARATPRAWLSHGRRIALTQAPTRHGALSYSLESRLDEGLITAAVTLPDGGAGDVRLRLRVPAPYVMTSIEVDGEPWPDLDAGAGEVRLPRRGGRVDVIAYYRRVT